MGTSKNQEAASGATVKKRGQFKEIWRRLKKNKMAMIGLGIVVFLVLISIFADFLFDYNTVVIKQNTAIRLQTPSAAHWLGTDEFGRDILARLVHGSRVSLSVGVVAVSIALLIGGSLGAIAGFYGGKIDNVIMRIMDIFLAVPSLLLSITIVSALGPSIFNLMLAIAISSVPGYRPYCKGSGIRRGGEMYRSKQLRDHFLPYSPELHGTDHRSGIFKGCIRDPFHIRLKLPWPRRKGSDTGVGRNAFRRTCLLKKRSAPDRIPGYCDHHYDPFPEPVRRWSS